MSCVWHARIRVAGNPNASVDGDRADISAANYRYFVASHCIIIRGKHHVQKPFDLVSTRESVFKPSESQASHDGGSGAPPTSGDRHLDFPN